MSWQGKTVLVTGGFGFIGATLVRQLHELGSQVRVFDDLSSGRAENLDGVPVEVMRGDIRDQDAVGRAVSGVQAVVHLAAHGGVAPSVEDPVHNFSVNVQGTLNLLLAAKDEGVDRFIFASSNAIFGDIDPPADETKAPSPLSPYGASKLAGEGYCLAFHRTYGLPTCSLRFGHVYGPYSDKKSSVVAAFLKNLLAGENLVVYGDGQQTRDFVFVEDLCQAIVLAGERDCAGHVFQIASGSENTINHLGELLCSLAGVDKSRIVYEPPRAGEAYRIYSSIDKARRVLGFEPNVRLEEGLKTTYEWFANNPSRLAM